jgi:hypothetical protein
LFVKNSFMNRNRLLYSLTLISAVFLSAAPCLAELWTEASSFADAAAKAKAEGKMIMADFGRVGCQDCYGMTANFHEPSMSRLIAEGCVFWGASYDSLPARPWASLFPGASLPVVCYIDPNGQPGSFRDASTGLIPLGNLSSTLTLAGYALPLVVTNLPRTALSATDLNNGQLTLGGVARTNSTLIGAIRGRPITDVLWQVEESGVGFQSVTRLSDMANRMKSWSADFQPQPGTNTFKSYVVYDTGAGNTINSWTNVVRFVYEGVATCIAPTVVLSPTNQAVTAGQDVTLTVAGGGTGPLSYQWKFGGANLADGTYGSGDARYVISGAASSQLIISNAQTSANQGDYTVVITNLCGITTAVAHLDVNCGPLVSAQNQDQSVSVGGTATFRATVYGTPPLHFQWQKDGVNLTDDSPHISGATDTTLVVSDVQSLDAGVYRLSVSNLCLIVANDVGRLTISTTDTSAPDLEITSHTDLQAVATSAIVLSGTASDGGRGDSGITNVTVNGSRATNATASGSAVAHWSRAINLTSGTNKLQVVATDGAGNSATNVIRIISDTVRPTLALTSPTANQRWSNAVFTVRGTARDNRAVAAVWCQTNGVWGSVSTANGWTNWNVAVSLVPGTNTVRAYSQDAAGNLSPTQSVSFIYVLSDHLVVQTNGRGTVSPNYNGRVLEIGKSYTMTATAASGFAFTNWTTCAGEVLTNKPVIRFVMQSNLCLQANFVDVAKPTLAITAPTANQRWSNAVFTVRGTAKDNVQVSNVWCQTNGVWGPVATGNSWTNWTVEVALVPGTNTVRAYAEDGAGNRSLTNSVKFIYVVSDRLVVQATGPCTVSPNYSNAVLEIGKSYSMTATPKTGYIFSNWVGTVSGNVVVVTNTPRLTFIMQSNLVLQANIIPNPFIPLKGAYAGLFYPTTANSYMAQDATATNTGLIKLSLTDQGSFSGSLLLRGSTLPFSGKFNAELKSQVSVARLGQTPVGLNLELYPAVEDARTLETLTNVLAGTVADGSLWSSDLCAYRAATGGSNVYAGAYMLLIEGCIDWGLCFGDGFASLPDGDSPAAVKITSAGALQMSGTLADGALLSQSVTVSEQGCWPLFVSLYSGKGFLAGWLGLATNQVGASVNWQMPPGVFGRFNTNGFLQSRMALLTPYVVPPPGRNAVNWSNATVVLTGGNLPMPADWTNAPTSHVLVSNNIVRVIGGTITNLSVTITAGNGLFNGTFVNPVTGLRTSFKGALLQEMDTPVDGGGWWLGPNGQGGNIRFHAE